MHRPPYFDWRLDRWKIGLALLLWLGLLFYAPVQPASPAPQGASPVVRPGQRPVVGGSTQTEAIRSVTQPLLTAPPIEPENEVTPPAQMEAEAPPLIGSLTLAILEPGETPLTNNTPLFFGQTTNDGIVELLLEQQRYTVLADGDGYWQFAPVKPLLVGMTWVQAREVKADGSLLPGKASYMALVGHMALVGTVAQPVAAPEILTPLPSDGLLSDSTPLLSGSGPVDGQLAIYARRMQIGARQGMSGVQPVGEAQVNGEGTWRWHMSDPLPAGATTLWAVAVDKAGVPLSRSWPVTLDIAADAQPSAAVTSSTVEVNTTR